MRTATNQDQETSNGGKARCDRTTPPLSTKRGAALTDRTQGEQELTASIHWLAATTTGKEADVLGFVSATLGGADFETSERGVSGYTRTYRTIYGLRLFVNDERPEMGLHMIADGHACESIGYDALRMIYNTLELSSSTKPKPL